MNLSPENKCLFAAYANMAYDNFLDVISFILKSNNKSVYENNKSLYENNINSLLELINSEDKLLSGRVTRSVTKSFPCSICFRD